MLGFNLIIIQHSLAPGICRVDIVSSTLSSHFSGKKCRIDNMRPILNLGRELSISLSSNSTIAPAAFDSTFDIFTLFAVSQIRHWNELRIDWSLYIAQSSYCIEFPVQWSSACLVHWQYLLSQLNAVCCLWQPFSQIFSLAINKVSADAYIRKPNNLSRRRRDIHSGISKSAFRNDKMLDALALERALLPLIHIYFDFFAKQQR